MCEMISAAVIKPVESDLHRVREDARSPAVQSELGLPSRAVAAGAAAFVSAIVVNPLDIVKTRLQVQAMFSSLPEPTLSFSGACPRACPRLSGGQLACSPSCYVYSDSWDAMKKIARQEGLHRLWKGTGSALLMAVPTVGIYLPAYEALHNHLSSPTMPAPVRAGAAFLSGAASRTMAVLACAPLEFTRTRIQAVPGETGVLAVMRSLMRVNLTTGASDTVTGDSRSISSRSGGSGTTGSITTTVTGTNPSNSTGNRGMPGGAAASSVAAASRTNSPVTSSSSAAPAAAAAAAGRASAAAAAGPAASLPPSLWSRVRIMYTGAGTQLARDVPFSAIYWATLEPTRRFLTAENGPLHALLGRWPETSPVPTQRACASSSSFNEGGSAFLGRGARSATREGSQRGGITEELLETSSCRGGGDDVSSAEQSKLGAGIAAGDSIGVVGTGVANAVSLGHTTGTDASINDVSGAASRGYSVDGTSSHRPSGGGSNNSVIGGDGFRSGYNGAMGGGNIGTSVAGSSRSGAVTGSDNSGGNTGNSNSGIGIVRASPAPSQAEKDRVMVAGSIISGFLSGGFAAAITTPLDVIKTTRQIEVDPSQPRSMGTIAMMSKIVRERGPRVLFSGVTARVARVAPSCAIVLAAYEATKVLLLKTG